MPLSPDQFGKSVIKAGLSTADDLKALWAALAPGEKPKDGEAFSKVLIDRQLLTPFQAERLLNGQADSLVLGDYVLLERLGAGGMGEVFKARHREMDRLVAIKLLPPDVTKDDDAIKRFQREVKAAARLSHPNIVTAFDASKKNGRNYLVMEFVDGDDLAALLKKSGPLPVLRAVDYITQAARGLAYAHEQGVIHRDIKPANLLLDANGTVKILDMGLARLEGVSERRNEALTTSGQMMGTVDYMAPEQAADTRTADARSDIYSLGCTLFKLLTGQNVFTEDTLVKTIIAHMENPIPSLTTHCPAAPPELEAVFERMVAKEPSARFQTMREVEQALTDCRPAITRGGFDVTQTFAPVGWTPRPSASPTNPTSNSPAIPDGRGVHPTGVSRRWLWLGLAAALLLVTGGIYYGVNRSTSSNSPTEPSTASPPSSENSPYAPPTLAKAPFDGRAYQAAWANHLKVDVSVPNSLGMQMVLIPPGEFMMGTSDEELVLALKMAAEMKLDPISVKRIKESEHPQHLVRITKPFRLCAHEVTIRQFAKFVEQSGYKTQVEEFGENSDGDETSDRDVKISDMSKNWRTPGHKVVDNSPVTQVSWTDTVMFCNWLSSQEKLEPCYVQDGNTWTLTPGLVSTKGEEKQRFGYRLPTEAEWEYACRAGTTTQFSFGDDWHELEKYGWSSKSADGRAHTVGLLSANPFGIYDMHGNVSEWCYDWIDGKWYGQSPSDDPVGPSGAVVRVLRGGGWKNTPAACRSAYRYNNIAPNRSARGFRLALTLDIIELPRSEMWQLDAAAPESKSISPAPAKNGDSGAKSSPTKLPPPAVAPFNAQSRRPEQAAKAVSILNTFTPRSSGGSGDRRAGAEDAGTARGCFV